jgi:hypothetical protein
MSGRNLKSVCTLVFILVKSLRMKDFSVKFFPKLNTFELKSFDLVHKSCFERLEKIKTLKIQEDLKLSDLIQCIHLIPSPYFEMIELKSSSLTTDELVKFKNALSNAKLLQPWTVSIHCESFFVRK